MIGFAKKNCSVLFVLLVTLGFALSGCGGDDGGGGGSGGGGGVACSTLGSGSTPISGSGTENDPYIITPGESYAGCAPAQLDPGPIYGIELTTPGTYTITQTNGVTDLELWLYEEDGTLLGVIDDKWSGYDESYSGYVAAGRYGIEVYNNGDEDGPFTLTVTGP